MSDPFRSHGIALEARTQAVLDEIEVLRERLAAYEGENRNAVVAAQLERLRADIRLLLTERQELIAELRRIRILGESGADGED
jgi:hypothetical protein